MPPKERHYKSGQVLFKEGDTSFSMFVIKQGGISVRKRKGPSFVEIAKLYSNEILGEVSFFDKEPRSATAVALTDVIAVEIEYKALETIFNKMPPYVKAIVGSLASRLRKADETIRNLKKNTMHLDEVSENEFSETGADGEATEKPATEGTEGPSLDELLKETPEGSDPAKT